MQKPTKDELTLMIDIIRGHYPLIYCSEMQDLIHLVYLEFNIELTPDDVREFCIEIDEDKQSIFRVWNLI